MASSEVTNGELSDQYARVLAREGVHEPALMVRADAAARMIDVSPATWHRMVAAGKTPAPIRLSPGSVRWRTSDLAEWVARGCPDRQTFDSIRQGPSSKGFSSPRNP
ncbi:MAG: hypothetical protein KDA52_01380 [Planctomycetaceae bacterium]|nr:hypothetical protein [Planctomycetaceae bacterium]